jgi:predicted component of type VI protein secretion system
MLARFEEELNGRGAIEVIVDLKQRPNETIEKFFDRVTLSMDRKNYRATEEERETETYKKRLEDDTYTFFAAGMHEELRLQALGGVEPPATARELLRAARNADRERRRSKRPKFLAALDKSGDSGARYAAVLSAEEMARSQEGQASADMAADHSNQQLLHEIAELRTSLEAMRSKFGGKGRNTQIVCWNCDTKGHMKHECRKPSKKKAGQSSYKDSGKVYRLTKEKSKKSSKSGKSQKKKKIWVLDEDSGESDSSASEDSDEFDMIELVAGEVETANHPDNDGGAKEAAGETWTFATAPNA